GFLTDHRNRPLSCNGSGLWCGGSDSRRLIGGYRGVRADTSPPLCHRAGRRLPVCAPVSWGAGVYGRPAAPKAWKAAMNSVRCGCAALIAILTRRTLRVIMAPTLMSFSRIEPAVATANAVLWSPSRRNASINTYAKDDNHNRS